MKPGVTDDLELKKIVSWRGFIPSRTVIMGRLRTPSSQNPEPTVSAPDSLFQIASDLKDCARCKLCTTRKTVVFGEGNPNASLVFVGEGPGEQEDLQGRPFVGKAGQLLDRMIAAISLNREDVYICNVVKCRPPGNRNPESDEINNCQPFLLRQLSVIQPKIIVALGKFAAQTLLQTEVPITRLRGQFHSFQGIKLMPTFHPSYLLRNPEAKREAWIDLQQVAHELGLQIRKSKE